MTQRLEDAKVQTLCAVVLCLALAPLGVAAQGGGQLQRLERAAALVREGRVDEAERQLAAVLKAEPKEAGALSLLGTIRAQQGRLDEAETLFRRAVESSVPSPPSTRMKSASTCDKSRFGSVSSPAIRARADSHGRSSSSAAATCGLSGLATMKTDFMFGRFYGLCAKHARLLGGCT